VVEAVIFSRGTGGSYDARFALSIAFGYSAIFLRSLVYLTCEEARGLDDVVKALGEVGVWGGLVIVVEPPCDIVGSNCLEEVEEGVVMSEILEKPVVVCSRELVEPRPTRVPTFNRNWGRGLRWVHGVETSSTPRGPLLKLYACLWRKLRYRSDVPIVVVDHDLAYVRFVHTPDWSPIPTSYEPQGAWDLVDISVRGLSSVGIALGIAKASYDLGPIVVVTKEDTTPLSEARSCSRCRVHVLKVGEEGVDPCEGVDLAFRAGYALVSLRELKGEKPVVYHELCDGCGDCTALGCPSIEVGSRGIPQILDGCTGCGACVEVCSRGAIRFPQ